MAVKRKKDPRLARAGVSGFNKPKRTPKHRTKSHIVVAKVGNKIKTIRFGQQGAKTAGKVIKPLGIGFGVNAVKTAITKAADQGLDLNFADKVMAFDSGDAEIALNNARRRVDPEFAAQERAKDLAQMTDDFEEVGQSTFGKFNDQIKNIKLP